MWEIIFMVLVLKIPMVYVCWVVWWAIKAEPVVGRGRRAGARRSTGSPGAGPTGSRPRRGGPHGDARQAARAAAGAQRTEA